MPGHGIQISARVPTEGFVQTDARAPSLNRAYKLLHVVVLQRYQNVKNKCKSLSY